MCVSVILGASLFCKRVSGCECVFVCMCLCVFLCICVSLCLNYIHT